jgi:hypothetical protein
MDAHLRRPASPSSNVESSDSKRARLLGSAFHLQPETGMIVDSAVTGRSSIFHSNSSLFQQLWQPFGSQSATQSSQSWESKLPSATHIICPSTSTNAYCYAHSDSTPSPPDGQPVSSIILPPSTLMPSTTSGSTSSIFSSPTESADAIDASDFDPYSPEASAQSASDSEAPSPEASHQSASTVERIDKAYAKVLPEFEIGLSAHHRCPPIDVSDQNEFHLSYFS